MFEHFDMMNMIVLSVYFILAYLCYTMLGIMQLAKHKRLVVPKDAMIFASVLWPITLVVFVCSTTITWTKELFGIKTDDE